VYLPKIRFLSQGVWAVGEGQKIKKPKNGVFFHKTEIFWFFKKFVCLHFQLKTTCKKSDSYLLWVFHNRLFNYWKKSKRPITQWKNKISKNKKYSFCAFTIRVYMPKIRFLGWMVWAVGEGQTKIRQDRPKTEALWNFYFLFLSLFFFIGGLIKMKMRNYDD